MLSSFPHPWVQSKEKENPIDSKFFFIFLNTFSFRIPEIFAYVNSHIYKNNPKYYETYGIRKFGYWIQEVKKKPNQELDELFMSGMSKNLMRTFNKQNFPATLFLIFCTGGIDFVGGYTYYQFLKHNLFATEQSSLNDTTQRKLGILKLQEENGD